jgi:hypothetical protein
MNEAIQFREPIRDPKWLTPEGAQESVHYVSEQVTKALSSTESFWEYIQPGWHIWPRSPFEHSTHGGMRTLGFFESLNAQETEAIRQCMLRKGYPVDTIIASAVFQEERVGVSGLVNPEEQLFLQTALDGMMNQARQARSSGEAVEILETLVSGNISFRYWLTPEGRVEMMVEPTIQIIQNSDFLQEAIRMVRTGYGGWGKPQESDYSRAVALALEKLIGMDHSTEHLT